MRTAFSQYAVVGTAMAASVLATVAAAVVVSVIVAVAAGALPGRLIAGLPAPGQFADALAAVLAMGLAYVAVGLTLGAMLKSASASRFSPRASPAPRRGARGGGPIRALAPAHREVLGLARGAGLTLPEVAGLLQIPVGTVKAAWPQRAPHSPACWRKEDSADECRIDTPGTSRTVGRS